MTIPANNQDSPTGPAHAAHLVAGTAFVLATLFSLATLGACRQTTHEDPPSPVHPANVTEIVNAVMEMLGNESSTYEGDVHIVYRSEGLQMGSAWADDRDLAANLEEALIKALLASDTNTPIDAVQIEIVKEYRPVNPDADRGPLTNSHRGIHGLELVHAQHTSRITPLDTLAFNRRFDDDIARFAAALRVEPDDIQIRVFETRSLLARLQPHLQIDEMFRGNQIVELHDITLDNVRAFANAMGEWLTRQVHPDGRMTYKYWPSRGEDSTTNNMIRQFMATVALGRWAHHLESPQVAEKHIANLNYNCRNFYRKDGAIGYIQFDGKVKLGAAAIAGLAIVESGAETSFKDQRDALLSFIDHMQNPDGSFVTWYRGPTIEWDTGHNFYPGEALLFLATVYDKQPDPELLQKIVKSFEYYRTWHRANQNPAFVPWHTQAYYTVWRHTEDPGLRDFIFEMNDWLVELQQWDTAPYDDMRGRFYDPKRSHYGPPHASSTAVYLEGLADAYSLARAVSDTARAENYRRSILRGLRSAMQLQFADDIDMFYVSKRDRVQGGIRTTVYNNEIRVDNVQHTLMAVLKILATFTPKDYKLPN